MRIRSSFFPLFVSTGIALLLGLLVLFLPVLSVHAAPTLSISPITWNIIGLDSNLPTSGPYRFPIGVRVCNTSGGATTATINYIWDDSAGVFWGDAGADPYINLRAGSLASTSLTFTGNGCKDAYFEVEVKQVSAAYDKTRRYHITATDGSGPASTSTPRELYVEHLISQNRNGITDIKLNGVSIPAGGAMSLMVGNTYTIELDGFTATQGYNQLESFINFPNTIFQVQAVTTTYSADNSPYVPGPAPTAGDKLYSDACLWDNNPGSPTYRSCIGGDYKAGGTVTTIYTVKIISGAGTSESLTTLLYDFSGSSYHYNADYTTGARIVSIVGPSSMTIQKIFNPKAIAPGGTASVTFKLVNPTTEIVSGVNFTDSLPGNLVVSNTVGLITSGCGSGTFSPALSGGAKLITFTNGTISPNSTCSISLNVTAPAPGGTYLNTTGHLFINGTTDTGNTGTDTLTAASAAACLPGQTLATWTMPTSGQGSGGPPPPYATKASNVVTATASYVGGTESIDTGVGLPINSWAGKSFDKNKEPYTSSTTPYFQLVVDTSKYTNIQVSLNSRADSNWNANSTLKVWSSADSGTFSATTPPTATLVGSGNWSSTQTFTAAASGAITTTFRINADGAQNTNGNINLDNIVVTGCGVPAPAPMLSKTFSPATITTNAVSTLSFTISNTQTSNITITNVIFTDTLPGGLQVASPPVTSTTGANCTGVTFNPLAGATTIYYTATQMKPGAVCTAQVNVKPTRAGQFNNVSDFITSSESGPNQTATGYGTASLTAIAPPVLEKSFSPAAIFTGDAATLSFKLTNPNASSALSGIVFTDTLPVSLTVASGGPTLTCGGSLTTASPQAITFAGGSLAANSSCTFNVTVTGALTGTITNTTTAVLSTEGGTGNVASASIVVANKNASLDLTKQVSPNNAEPWARFISVTTGSQVYYRFKVYNSGDLPFTALSVTDPTLAGTAVDPATCNWSATLPLAPGATGYCTTGPIAASTGAYTNTATANGTYASGVKASAPVSATYGTTGLTLSKSAAETAYAAVGDVLHYSYIVTNTGYAPLLGPVTITDTKTSVTCPAVTTIVPDGDEYLDPGEQLMCTATYPVVVDDVTAKSVTNSALATVNGVKSNLASKTINLKADLTIAKSNNVGGSITLGNTFTWTVAVTNSANSGTATFLDTQTVLTDTLPSAGATYAVGAVTAAGVSGTINCVLAANGITCSANGAVAIQSGGAITVPVTVTPTVTGSLVNLARVDPDNVIPEISEANNEASNTVTVTSSADLTISKTNGQITAIPGQPITYTVIVTNTGPSPVVGAVVSDTMPSALVSPVWTCAASIGSSCATSNGSGNINTTVNLASVNSTATFTITATISPAATGTLANTATITVPVGTTDSNPNNNSATDTDTLTPQADLSIAKSHAGIFNVGVNGTYAITVTNNGPSTAAATIRVTDTLPTGLGFVSNTGTGWSCSAVSQVVSCNNASALAPSAASVLTLTVSVAPSVATLITNTVTVTSPTTDPNLPNNTVDDQTLVNASADLAVAKTHAGNFTVGQNGVYTITVTNNGAGVANGTLYITDTLPAGLGFVAASGSGWMCGSVGQSVNCSNPSNLNNGASSFITLTVSVGEAAYPSVGNVVTTTSATPDTITTNNIYTDTTTILAAPNLGIAKSDGGVSKAPGATLVYTLTYSNTGNIAASNTIITETVPTNTTFAGPAGTWSCAVGAVAGSICTRNVGTVLADSINRTTNFTLTVNNPVSADATQIANTATIGNDGTHGADSNTDNNSASDTTPLTGLTHNLTIGKSDGGASVAPSGTVAYTIYYTNTGNIGAAHVTITDTIPTNTTFNAGASDARWTCGATDCTADVGTVNGNTSGSIVIAFTVNSSLPGGTTTITNNVRIGDDGTSGAESNTGDNTAQDTTPIVGSPVLQIGKSDGGITATPGGNIVYTIAFTNTGNIGATNVTISDTIPANTAFVAASNGGTFASGRVTWNVGALAANASGTRMITVSVNSPLPAGVTTIANTVAITSTETPTPVTGTDTTPLNVSHDLTISKNDGGASATPGATIAYTVRYTNAATSNIAAANVLITETVPNNTTFAGPTGTWTCNVGDGAGTLCVRNIGTLGVGANSSVQFTVRVVSPLPSGVNLITNSVRLGDDGTSGAESDPNNNTAQDTTPLTVAPELAITKSDGGLSVTAGSIITYTLWYTNNGNIASTNVVITETVPAETTFFGPAGTWSGCTSNPASPAGTPCTYGVASLNGSASGSVQFAVRVNSPPSPGVTTLSNTARIGDNGANGTDADPNNNVTTDTTPLSGNLPDLQIIKSHTAISVTHGSVLTFTLNYTNTGGITAPSAFITDVIPVGTTFNLALSTFGWLCNPDNKANSVCRLNLGDVAPNGNGAARFVVTVDDSLAGSVTQINNTARITDNGTNGTDPTPNNNVSSDAVPVAGNYPDVTITKTHTGNPLVGQTIVYTLKVNNVGLGPTTGPITVTDILPNGLSLVSVTAPGWSCGVTSKTSSLAMPTLTRTPTATWTRTATWTPTWLLTATRTLTSTVGATTAITRAATMAATLTRTATVTPTALPTQAIVKTATLGATPVPTPPTRTPTVTSSPPTQTATPTRVTSRVAANTPTLTPTRTPTPTVGSKSFAWVSDAAASAGGFTFLAQVVTPTATATRTATQVVAPPATATRTTIQVVVPTATATRTTPQLVAPTATNTRTSTVAASAATSTPTKTAALAIATIVPASAVTTTASPTPTARISTTPTPTTTRALTPTVTFTRTPTRTPTATPRLAVARNVSGQQFTCTFTGILNPGDSATLTATVLIGPEAVPAATNVASVQAAGDPDISNDSSSDLVNVTNPSVPNPPAPKPAEVPEADTLLLFASGGSGLATYVYHQWRRRRRV